MAWLQLQMTYRVAIFTKASLEQMWNKQGNFGLPTEFMIQ